MKKNNWLFLRWIGQGVSLLLVLVLGLIAAGMPVSAATNTNYNGEGALFWEEDYSNHFFGNQLTTSYEKQLYYALERDIFTNTRSNKSQIVYFQDPIVLPASTNPENHTEISRLAMEKLQRALDAFRFDHPEMYWVTGGSVITDLTVGRQRNGQLVILSASGTFQPSSSNYQQDDAIMTAKINQLVGEASQISGDFNRLAYIHNSLAKNIKYDTNMPPVPRSHQITGGLVDQRGVCETYSKIFKLVAERLGYETVLVGGVGLDRGFSTPHMWNYVKVQGGWYGVDVTWDDQAITIGDYLLVGRYTPSPNFSGTTFGDTHVEEYTFYPVNYVPFYYPTLSSTLLPRPW